MYRMSLICSNCVSFTSWWLSVPSYNKPLLFYISSSNYFASLRNHRAAISNRFNWTVWKEDIDEIAYFRSKRTFFPSSSSLINNSVTCGVSSVKLCYFLFVICSVNDARIRLHWSLTDFGFPCYKLISQWTQLISTVHLWVSDWSPLLHSMEQLAHKTRRWI